VGLGVWLIVSMSACAWVELTPQAAAVKLAPNEAAVADCQHVGGVRAQTRARVGLFSRSPEKVAEELATMAKNDAVELKGNTVLAEGRPSIDGAQRFLVYRCPAPSN
jgi:hypothetical protein